MRKKNLLSASRGIALKLKALAKEKENVRRKLVVTAAKLRLKAKQLAVTAKEKENVRRKLVITAEELKLKAKNLAVTAREKEDTKRKLEVTAEKLRIKAQQLAVTAKEKESIRRKLEVTAEALKQKAKQLAVTAKEKEDTKHKLEVTAEELSIKAKHLALTAKEKESIRRKLVVTAKKLRLKARQLAVTAGEKESVRRKLVVIARKLRLKAAQFSASAKDKENVRRKLVVTAEKLQLSRETLERKVIERTKECEEIRAKDEAILASIGDGLVATDTKKRILLVNKAFERLLGWKNEEILGKMLHKIIPVFDGNGEAIPESERLVSKTLRERTTHTTSTTMYYGRKDGASFPVAITVAPIFIGKKLIGTVKVFRDITKEKEIEKAKSEFMSIASHQLRTPLTAIRWALSSLKRGNQLSEEQRTLVSTAHETSTNMAVTIRRMLMISHLEEGGTEPNVAQVDLCAVLRKVARLHDAHRLRSGLELMIRCPDNLQVRTDEELLVEILDNLVSNAYKYTPKGGTVSISASKEAEKICIDIADTGYGIPKEEQKRIPEKFFRASNIASPAEAGTGIGLYMVYNIARILGGEISFVSKQNKGTTFTLCFPA